MALAVKRLHVLAYAAGTTLWLYKLDEDELVAAVHTPGYFDDAGELIAHGDEVHFSGPDGCAIRWVQKHAGHVTMRLMA